MSPLFVLEGFLKLVVDTGAEMIAFDLSFAFLVFSAEEGAISHNGFITDCNVVLGFCFDG